MRVWQNKGQDDGSIHVIGNGEMLTYFQGPNIAYLFGPPYSSPSSLKMEAECGERSITVASDRERDTAIWHHAFCEDGIHIMKMTDYMLPNQNVLFRDVEATVDFSFKIMPTTGLNPYIIPGYFQSIDPTINTLLISIPKGANFFFGNSMPWETEILICTTGNISISKCCEGDFMINIGIGGGRILFCGGLDLPSTVETLEQILLNESASWIELSRNYWKEFKGRRHDFALMIPDDHIMREKMLEAIDSISVLIKCQQSKSGGVAAGHYYQVAYVRDMFGVSRGLLALGYTSEVRAILQFWLEKFRLFGNLLNAEGMGNGSARLLFTNDEVEIPAYVILNCFNYYECTGDEAMLREMIPVMEWALEVQLGHLCEGMTEFSGDETYIAGGTYPAHKMYQGSAESTLLFITGSEKLIAWVENKHIWNIAKLERYKEIVSDVKMKYRKNFMSNGKLFVNQPLRETIAGKPRFRFSFCEAHDAEQKSPIMAWTELDGSGFYKCPDCHTKVMPHRKWDDTRYELNSVYLVPMFIGNDMFLEEELQGFLDKSVQLFDKLGFIPSNVDGNRSLGYDYGLTLYNAVKMNHPSKDALLHKVLGLLDPTCAWVEYYDADKPFNCRARAWESAINIEAVIEYIRHIEK
jgi:hypothetical protein